MPCRKLADGLSCNLLLEMSLSENQTVISLTCKSLEEEKCLDHVIKECLLDIFYDYDLHCLFYNDCVKITSTRSE